MKIAQQVVPEVMVITYYMPADNYKRQQIWNIVRVARKTGHIRELADMTFHQIMMKNLQLGVRQDNITIILRTSDDVSEDLDYEGEKRDSAGNEYISIFDMEASTQDECPQRTTNGSNTGETIREDRSREHGKDTQRQQHSEMWGKAKEQDRCDSRRWTTRSETGLEDETKQMMKRQRKETVVQLIGSGESP